MTSYFTKIIIILSKKNCLIIKKTFPIHKGYVWLEENLKENEKEKKYKEKVKRKKKNEEK